jgi:hypothetical protein
LGRRLLLERRHRTPSGSGIRGAGAPVSALLARRRRRAAPPGARVPGRPDDCRRPFLRRADHDRARRRGSERRRARLHHRLRARRGRDPGRALLGRPAHAGARTHVHGLSRLWLALGRRLRQPLRGRRRPDLGAGDVRGSAGARSVGFRGRDGRSGLEVAAVLVSRRPRTTRRSPPTPSATLHNGWARTRWRSHPTTSRWSRTPPRSPS